MRAFMSDRTHARRTVACGRVGSTLADMAEREARRILAETEPENSRSYHGRAYIPDGILPHHEALAEALAAFVAEQPSESRYYSSCAHGLMGVAARGALAEALTAFVAEGEGKS